MLYLLKYVGSVLLPYLTNFSVVSQKPKAAKKSKAQKS